MNIEKQKLLNELNKPLEEPKDGEIPCQVPFIKPSSLLNKLEWFLTTFSLPFVLMSIAFVMLLCYALEPKSTGSTIKTNHVFVTNYITKTNITFVNPDLKLKYKCPVYTNKWHEITENCLDYKK